MSEYVSLKIWPKTKVLFDSLGKECGLSHTKLIDVMCQFFLQHKISPLESPEGIFKERGKLEKLEKKNMDRIIGFMRTQEMRFLAPIESKVNYLIEGISEVLENNRKEKTEEMKMGESALSDEIDRRSKLRLAREKVLEVLSKVKEKNNLLGKNTLELESVNKEELGNVVKLLEEIDPDVY